MGGSINKSSLNGVIINFNTDFMLFAKERYEIYLRRQAGMSQPWSNDPIFQNYRFTNIFRDDDKTSTFIYEWVKPFLYTLEYLVSNLIYARLCNKPNTMLATGLITSTFDPIQFISIIDNLGGGKTKSKVNVNPVWKGPYQVSGSFTKLGYPYREQLIAYHIPKTASLMSEAITSTNSNTLEDYLVTMNKIWGYKANMVFTQALLDLSFLRPDLISPTVVVPLSSGVEPLIDNLQIPYIELVHRAMELWNAYSTRTMYFKDAEHALCEFRKYLCWKHGTSNPRHFTPSL